MENQTNELSQMTAENRNIFCQHWPTAKRVLEIIRALIPDDRIKKTIDEIIKWGDRVHAGCSAGK